MSQRVETDTKKDFVLKILSGSHKGKQLKLLSSEIKIGRASDCDVIFKDDSSCSRHHAQIKRQEDSFLVQSLNEKNLVLVNKKAIKLKVLQPGDEIQLGNTTMLFIEQRDSLMSPSVSSPKKRKSGQTLITPARLILFIVLIAGAFLYFYEDQSKLQEEKKIQLNTELDVLKQVEELQEQNKEEIESLALSFKQKPARTAFIAGFRDYRKGYFYRALKMFKHCSMLDKGNELCRRYELKSVVQIEKLIQKKVRLGNSYKANKQYKACEAVFKSVETMVQDTNSAVYKDAKAKRQSCSLHLRNKI